MADVELPTYRAFLQPVLKVIDQAHGSATKQEVDEAVIEVARITPQQLGVVYPLGSKAKGSKILHRIAFARSTLKLCGALENAERGIWTITPVGRELLLEGAEAIRQADAVMRKRLAVARDTREQDVSASSPEDSSSSDDETIELAQESAEISWKEQVLDRVQALDAYAFERLCARLLRLAGCRSVEVTSRSGDQGIDGVGVLEISLLSFPVFFQAKKYRNSVGPAEVRELRGAMAGRGDKGILITSGTFSRGAKEEATRPGVPPLDLIDGDRLCDLLLEHRLGLDVMPVMDSKFFDDL